ncbi:hypothetical protein Gohar_023647 [Gossypium harknessii]|uniref:EF-hand domain-containing protein n=2 Tax=Gossypium TaxID=3633 RepID=A0A7J9HDJ6_9ROSI|nr:hypothetical protein [Gossypium harknessii]
MGSRNVVVFEDFFPAMVEKLGAEGFMKELSNGFQLLVDGDKGVITFESLKRNSALLGLKEMSDEEVVCMLREGDLDGDGALNEMEFCTLMLRLSPELMNNSRNLLEACSPCCSADTRKGRGGDANVAESKGLSWMPLITKTMVPAAEARQGKQTV